MGAELVVQVETSVLGAEFSDALLDLLELLDLVWSQLRKCWLFWIADSFFQVRLALNTSTYQILDKSVFVDELAFDVLLGKNIDLFFIKSGSWHATIEDLENILQHYVTS